MPILAFGHKNPDTDSVASAIALSHLKNKLGYDTIPCVLGSLNKESSFVLDYFNIPAPSLISNVKIQVKDLNIDKVSGIMPDSSILSAYKFMESNNIKTLVVTDANNKLTGIITMKDIAMQLIRGDFYNLNTSVSNIASDLNGKVLAGEDMNVIGKILVIAYDYETVKAVLNDNTIIIVGDRYDIIEHAISAGVKLIIITGGNDLPAKCLNMAQSAKVPVISVPSDTYTTSKLINQCNFISTIMIKDNISTFNESNYLDEVKEETLNTSYRNYPVVDDNNTFLGFINRRHVLNPGKKKVILVDHNEYSQSADGLNEAEILEIVDHHKIGDISTSIPISFRNIPVGSTCTIIYQIFREMGVDIDYKIAGLLISGIISDTLYFRSPTTTDIDRKSVHELNLILNMNLDHYSTQMFKSGTSLEGHSIEDIFYKDFKEFILEQYKVGIGQVFTLDIESIFKRKDQFTEFINQTFENRSYYLLLLVITDILKQGSYLIYKCKNEKLISTAFKVEPVQGVFVSNIISRKKQVIPKIIEGINLLRR